MYLIRYLRGLYESYVKTFGDQDCEILENGGEEENIVTTDGKTISKNEQYLIKKLRSSNVSLEKVDEYLDKLKGDIYQEKE